MDKFDGFLEKNSSCKRLWVIFLVLVILGVGSVSAAEWDNVIDYKNNNMTVIITNWLGLGAELGTATLTSHNTPEDIVPIIVGKGRVPMYYKFNFEDIYENGLGEVIFTDLNTDLEIIKPYKFVEVIRSNESYNQAEEYDCLNNELVNKSIKRSCKVRYKLIEYNPIKSYVELEKRDIPKGEIEIGLMIEVYTGDYVDAVWTIAGKKVSKHASYQESLNLKITHAYQFNESAGTNSIDSRGRDMVASGQQYNATLTNAVFREGRGGSFGNALFCDGTDDKATTSGGTVGFPTGTDEWAFSFWINATAQSWKTIYDLDGVTNEMAMYVHDTGTSTIMYYVDTEQDFANTAVTTFDGSTYSHIIIQRDSNGYVQLYANGTLADNSSHAGAVTTGNFVWCSHPDNTEEFSGELDEFYIFNKTLTEAEIANLYDNHDGTFYTTTFDVAPVVTLNSPADTFLSASASVTLNCSAIDADTITDAISLYINGSWVETNTGGVNPYFDLETTQVLGDGSYNWTCNATDDGNKMSWAATNYSFKVDTTPNITFIDPTLINFANVTYHNIPMNISLTETYFLNISFDIFNISSGLLTFTYNHTDSTRFINESFPDGSYEYNVTVWTSTGQTNTTETRTVTIDTIDPVFGSDWNMTENIIKGYRPVNKTWNFSVSDTNLDKCWYNTSDSEGINYTTCNTPEIHTNFSWGGVKQIYYYANDTAGHEVYANKSFIYYFVNWTQEEEKDPVIEGDTSLFNLTINIENIPTTTATLWYNYTAYSPTIVQSTTNKYYFSRDLSIPLDIGNTTGRDIIWWWEWKLLGATENTTQENQSVIKIEIDDCSTFGTIILNWTLLDEETNNYLEVALENITEVEVDLSLTSTIDASNTWVYSNITQNKSSGEICIPAGALDGSNQLYLDFVGTFRNNGTHVEEFYHLDNRILTNTSIPQFLFFRDLREIDSTSFITSFEDDFGIARKDAVISVLRKYVGDGVFKEVERSRTDDDGETITHLVEEDVIYKFNVTENDIEVWLSTEYRVFCEDIVSGTSCRIILNQDISLPPIDEEFGEPAGINTYDLSFNRTTRVLRFAFNLAASDTMNISAYPYTYNQTALETTITSNATTASSGTLTLSLPAVYGNKTIYVEVYKGNDLVTSKTISFWEKTSDYFGKGMALFISALVFLMLGLISVTQGSRAVGISVILGAIFLFGIGLVSGSITLIPLLTLVIILAVLIIIVISFRRSRD